MTRLFDVDDYPGSIAKEEPKPPQSKLYDIQDPNTWEMKFDQEATKDLDRLLEQMGRATTREDVVITALQILALSVNRDVIVVGKFDKEPKRISGLWK